MEGHCWVGQKQFQSTGRDANTTSQSSSFDSIVPNFNMVKTLTLLVHAGLVWCFHNPPNSDKDYRIFNVRK